MGDGPSVLFYFFVSHLFLLLCSHFSVKFVNLSQYCLCCCANWDPGIILQLFSPHFPCLISHLNLMFHLCNIFAEETIPSVIEICFRSDSCHGLLALESFLTSFCAVNVAPSKFNKNTDSRMIFPKWWFSNFAEYLNHLGALRTDVQTTSQTN